VHLVGFSIRNLTQHTVTWTSQSNNFYFLFLPVILSALVHTYVVHTYVVHTYVVAALLLHFLL